MPSHEKQTKQQILQGIQWILAHLIFPAIIVFLGILINNHYQSKKQPRIIPMLDKHKVVKIENDRYLVRCPFRISNEGGSSTKNEKITLMIPQISKIDEIKIPNEYRKFYEKKYGGPGYNYVVYELDLPKDKSIEGTVIFYCNIMIPERGIRPLKIY